MGVRGMQRSILGCILLGWLIVLPTKTWAGMPEVSGLGIRAQSMAGMGVALDNDPSASYYNPAGLVGLYFHNDIGMNLGLGVSTFDLKATAEHSIRGRYTPGDLRSATFIDLGFGLDLGRSFRDWLGGRSLVVGASVLIPTDSLYWWRLQFPEEERHPFYYDDIHRLVAVVGAGLEVNSWLSIGMSANILLKLETNSEGPVYVDPDDLQAILSGLGRNASEDYIVVEGDIAEDQKTKLAVSPIVGIQVRPTEYLTLGLTYHRELYMDDYGTNHVEVLIKPQDSNPLKVTFDYDHHFAHYYTPDQWAAGVRYTFGKGSMLSAEATYMQWSTFLDWLHERPIPRFKDVFAFKVGGEKQIIERNTYLGDVILRAGYGFWKSPVPEQRGETNFLDNDKHILAVGVECRRENLGIWWTKPVSVQAMAQYQYLVERSYTKDINGEKLTFGGYADAAGISMEFEF